MKINKKNFFGIIFIILFVMWNIVVSYQQSEIKVNEDPLIFYVLKSNPESMSYKEIIMNGKKVFEYSDIEKFDWETQTIYFKKAFINQLNIKHVINKKFEGGSAVLKIPSGYYFAWLLDEAVLYTGSFYKNGYSSVFQTDIYIHDSGRNSVTICYLPDTSDSNLALDKRYNEKMFNFLKNNN